MVSNGRGTPTLGQESVLEKERAKERSWGMKSDRKKKQRKKGSDGLESGEENDNLSKPSHLTKKFLF